MPTTASSFDNLYRQPCWNSVADRNVPDLSAATNASHPLAPWAITRSQPNSVWVVVLPMRAVHQNPRRPKVSTHGVVLHWRLAAMVRNFGLTSICDRSATTSNPGRATAMHFIAGRQSIAIGRRVSNCPIETLSKACQTLGSSAPSKTWLTHPQHERFVDGNVERVGDVAQSTKARTDISARLVTLHLLFSNSQR